MTLPLGIRGFNPIWVEVDLTGHLFDDTFYLFVLENTIPYIPATVYHDPNLNVPWTNPIQFLANGTLPVDIYFVPNVVYRLEFRKGPTQSDPLIYEVDNYMPGTGGVSPVDDIIFSTGNQITNPQFALINFESPYVLSTTDPDPIDIAPGWFLELAGTGTVTIERVALNDSNINPSNAPYALHLTLVGWNTEEIFLRQRFQQNGMLWANKTVSSALTARTGASQQSLSANLVDSENILLAQVLIAPVVIGQFIEYTGHGTLPDTTNSDIPPDAYIDYKLLLPNNSDIYLTSFQLIVQDEENISEPSFEQDSIDRQIDHTFHYYKDPLINKPIPSMLTAWDFALNPAQFGTDFTVSGGNPITTTPQYVWDQTIMATSASNIEVRRVSTSGALVVTTKAATQAFYALQYLSGPQAFETTLSQLCTNINVYQSIHTGVVCRVYMFYSQASGTIPAVATPFGTINAAGEFTLSAANWSPIPLLNSASNKFTLDNLNMLQDQKIFGFDGTVMAGTSSVANFAYVITCSVPTSGTEVIMNSISLQAGDIATRPAPQTADEVLRQCQQYYEKSYTNNVVAGTSTSINQKVSPMIIGLTFSPATMGVVANSFGVDFATSKRVAPTVHLYSPAGSIDTVTVSGFANGILIATDFSIGGHWQDIVIGTKRASYIGNFNGYLIDTGPGNISAAALYHFTADARLGVV